MKLLGISGSHKKGQNSLKLLEEAIKGVKTVNPSIKTKVIELAAFDINHCESCNACRDNPFECVVKDDFQVIFDEMKLTDAILFSIPHYDANPSHLDGFLGRFRKIHKVESLDNGFPLKDKPCGILVISGTKNHSAISFLKELEKLIISASMSLVNIGRQSYKGAIAVAPVTENFRALRHARILGKKVGKVLNE
ncbi:flavodoxin family protein [candidate division WOR-3 bacterium]|nr:flavodoxin family protein [candidate division WOR-3 bacterium]